MRVELPAEPKVAAKRLLARALITTLLVLGGLPLLVYPVVMLANIMSFAAEPSNEPVPVLLMLVVYAFLWATTLYPLAFLLGIRRSIANLKCSATTRAVAWASFPLAYLAGCVLLVVLWDRVE